MAVTILAILTWLSRDLAAATPPTESIYQPQHLILYYGHRHARACAPILSVGSGTHSRDRTGGRDLGAGPHRMSCPGTGASVVLGPWFGGQLSLAVSPANLTVSQISVSVASSAAWATRERRCQSGHQSPSHRCNRVRNVAFRPQRRILWAGNLRIRQISGTPWWHDLLRGESSLARRSGIRRPQCKGWRDGGSRAIPVLQNVPARPLA